jgi:hypothetical protein
MKEPKKFHCMKIKNDFVEGRRNLRNISSSPFAHKKVFTYVIRWLSMSL